MPEPGLWSSTATSTPPPGLFVPPRRTAGDVWTLQLAAEQAVSALDRTPRKPLSALAWGPVAFVAAAALTYVVLRSLSRPGVAASAIRAGGEVIAKHCVNT